MSTFKQLWRAQNGYDFSKSSNLSEKELIKIQQTIYELQQKGFPAHKIISALQRENASKLGERWKAERAFWTELKTLNTKAVIDAGGELDVEEYKIILSPNACKICRSITKNGNRIFKKGELVTKSGEVTPPFHPSCYCIVIPQ